MCSSPILIFLTLSFTHLPYIFFISLGPSPPALPHGPLPPPAPPHGALPTLLLRPPHGARPLHSPLLCGPRRAALPLPPSPHHLLLRPPHGARPLQIRCQRGHSSSVGARGGRILPRRGRIRRWSGGAAAARSGTLRLPGAGAAGARRRPREGAVGRQSGGSVALRRRERRARGERGGGGSGELAASAVAAAGAASSQRARWRRRRRKRRARSEAASAAGAPLLSSRLLLAPPVRHSTLPPARDPTARRFRDRGASKLLHRTTW